MPSLTSHLLKLDPAGLDKATQHPFLKAAATSSLPQAKLRHWLAQDRVYALSYVNFIGSLLAQLSVPTGSNRENSIEWRVADVLIDALDNIRREIRLFEQVAEDEGFKDEICDVECERATRCYQDLFAGSVAQGRPVIVGLVVLWATEECYLRSWKFAKEHLKFEGEGEADVMQKTFIPNWTSPEFEAFVRRLGGLVNKMCNEWGVEEGGWVWKECEAAWKQVVWVEGEFWPECQEAILAQ
ncbi:Putative thiaminase-2/PQQC, hem oxygenase-like, multi-helical [Septoria linicola]|uniref:Thiaminase-2/PQQC, hem oxygenase-like, multi-helical n=1 Tax=Septoria linicola TaxID=215465 RepID=A0A9Q9EME1_9PEZI|nr:Putative thiaminase-2/PQQC, hem oxygenase-like, multi-helical [Septoria linicola]